MAAFSHHRHVPFGPDFVYLPSVCSSALPQPLPLQQSGDLASTFSCFPSSYRHFDAVNDVVPPEMSTVIAGSSAISAIITTTSIPQSGSSFEGGLRVLSVDNKLVYSSSSSRQRSEEASQTKYSVQKNRRERQWCRSGSAHTKDAQDSRSRKPTRHTGAMKKEEEQKAPQVPTTGYIHVRARRGEATDSHSLAERVRREKIREKMKKLQDLVPGGAMVVGKALLLEATINYVKFLQSQVESLSTKLACMDPTLYHFSLHFDDYMIRQKAQRNMSPGLRYVQRSSHMQPPTAIVDTANMYPVHDLTVPFLLRGEGHPAAPSPWSSNDTTE